jgi:hypothetical protein
LGKKWVPEVCYPQKPLDLATEPSIHGAMASVIELALHLKFCLQECGFWVLQALESSGRLRLSNVTRSDLAVFWKTRNGHSPPKGCGRALLELAEAYAIQATALGGLKTSLRRKFETEPKGISGQTATRKARRFRQLSQGSKLLREWNGRTHHVDVVQGGFVWNGNKRQSLSAIAKEITGAHWSGPRFFGL